MKKLLLITLIALLVSVNSNSQSTEIDYGNNPNSGHFASVNGIKMYYEIYGEGEPLLLIHGNGGSIKSHKGRIE